MIRRLEGGVKRFTTLPLTPQQRMAEIGPVRRSRALPSLKHAPREGNPHQSRIRACLVISAFGDAMGACVDKDSLDTIYRRFGAYGIVAPPSPGEITAGTQLTLFTADALIRNALGANTTEDLLAQFRSAYLRWLRSQKVGDLAGKVSKSESTDPASGWLGRVPQLHNTRIGDVYVIASLRAGALGTIDRPVNDSDGFAPLQRVAPIGLMFDSKRAFEIAGRCAAITHGHPISIYSAGIFAHLLAELTRGRSLEAGLDSLTGRKFESIDARWVVSSLLKAVLLAKRFPKQASVVEDTLAEARADNVLAAAIYCVLSEPLVQRVCWGLSLAANQSGPSAATAAVAGALMGAWHGSTAINTRWLSRMELIRTIVQVSDDLAEVLFDRKTNFGEFDYPRAPSR